TGEVTATMLRDLGCRYVIVGHSERRSLMAETDQQVQAKVLAALEAGLTPILCVGEHLEQRRLGNTLDVCREQVLAALDQVPEARIDEVVVAYEPVWAIGTGETASVEQVREVHGFIRELLAERFGAKAKGVR